MSRYLLLTLTCEPTVRAAAAAATVRRSRQQLQRCACVQGGVGLIPTKKPGVSERLGTNHDNTCSAEPPEKNNDKQTGTGRHPGGHQGQQIV
jgi:hypothetical protein